jgi:peptidoglycan/LPS O-acetylase OafA/YrhL
MPTKRSTSRSEAELAAGTRLGYRPELNGLRAIAVSAVVVYHSLDESRFPGGFLGVDLFFLLSGFLITRLLLEERATSGGIALRSFYVRRGARLIPALLLVCLAGLLIAATQPGGEPLGQVLLGVGGALLYCTNVLRIIGLRLPMHHTWSLSVEEQFYLLWPLLLIVLLRWGGQRRASQVAALLVVAASVQIFLWNLSGSGQVILYEGSYGQGMVFLMAGCFLSMVIPTEPTVLARYRLARVARVLVLPASTVLVALLFSSYWNSPFYFDGGYAIVAGMMAVLLINALCGGLSSRLLSVGPVVWIGQISYGIYLWHFPMVAWVFAVVPFRLGRVAIAGITIVITLVCATASYYLVEMPIRSRVGSWYRRRSAPQGAQVAVSLAHS